jgi:signal transduction histidine kinase
VIAPALAARLDRAVHNLAVAPSTRPETEEALRALGREAEAAGAGMIDVASAFWEATAAAGDVADVAPLLACLLGPFETARGRQREALGRLMNVQEEERRRLAAEIHDESIQIMAAAYLRLQMLRRKLTSSGEREACEALEQTVKLAVQSLQRLILELKATALEATGLAAALGDYLEQVELDTGIAFRLVDGLSTQPGDQNRLILFRATQEAVASIAKNATATTVTVALSEDAEGFMVRIDNDGGFSAGGNGHQFPLARERAEAVGGSCRVEAVPGGSAFIQVWVPRTETPPDGDR